MIGINHLVGGFNHLEKYEFVDGKDCIYYGKTIHSCSKTNILWDISMTFPWTFHMIQATKAARLLVKNRSFLASKIAEKHIPTLCAF